MCSSLTYSIEYDIIILSGEASEPKQGKDVWNMGMTDKQFNGFVRFVLDDILEVLQTMPEGPEKKKLQKVADNLQKTLED